MAVNGKWVSPLCLALEAFFSSRVLYRKPQLDHSQENPIHSPYPTQASGAPKCTSRARIFWEHLHPVLLWKQGVKKSIAKPVYHAADWGRVICNDVPAKTLRTPRGSTMIIAGLLGTYCTPDSGTFYMGYLMWMISLVQEIRTTASTQEDKRWNCQGPGNCLKWQSRPAGPWGIRVQAVWDTGAY